MISDKIKAVRAAWEEMKQFGQGHEGQCDNQNDICPTCGTARKACTLHLKQTNDRMDKLEQVLAELESEIT